ncbi:hypothetical protein [Halomonas sp.]|uniref:hypothetical protein n=1 Tax=Halomonas sp. TaxID=1486246 RepID=UPI00384D63C6
MSNRADFTALINNTYRHAVWGSHQPENARELDRLHEETLRQGQPDLLAKVEQARRNGERAFELVQRLRKQLDEQGDSPALQDWLERQKARVAHPSMATSLDIAYQRWQKHQQRLAERRREPTYSSRLVSPDLTQGHHPNSLRHLPPARHWQILIDETGSEFSSDGDALTLSEHDSRLGKVVALAIPEGLKLPALPAGFHATHAIPDQVDSALQALLEAPVGIFGFSIKDQASRHHYWLGHVTQLIRWVLLMLPMQEQQNTRVSVLVEQRGELSPESDLNPLAQLIEGELKAFDAPRYGGLQLELAVMDKNGHTANGYVDTVAYTWGGSLAVNEDRLKRSRLLGHCLLQPRDEGALERLYLAAVEARRLPTEDWLALCDAVADTGEQSVLAQALAQYGQHVQRQPARWQALLDEVRHQQALKTLRQASLVTALSWLARYAPQGESLGPRMTLQLESAWLALANHQGQVAMPRLQTLLTLCQQLEEEDSPAACQALLRIAVSTTNNFEFTALYAVLEAWLGRPVAQPGLLNHAKLHSTLGQLDAFQGRYSQAIERFDLALAHFQRLSDPRQAQREAYQTGIYRLMARADANANYDTTTAQDTLTHLKALTGRPTLQQVVRYLATSGDQQRFAQHLLLRLLVSAPGRHGKEIAEYMNQSNIWQRGDSHPWGLILAYRGWMLALGEEPLEAALNLEAAVSTCQQPGQGVTLQWMGDVLQALGRSLELLPAPNDLPAWRQRLPAAPHDALAELAALDGKAEHAQRWDIFSRCLPYQFH